MLKTKPGDIVRIKGKDFEWLGIAISDGKIRWIFTPSLFAYFDTYPFVAEVGSSIEIEIVGHCDDHEATSAPTEASNSTGE